MGSTTTDIQQEVVEVLDGEKRDKLMTILGTMGRPAPSGSAPLDLSPLAGAERVLVFVETKRNADFLASFLSQEGFPTTSIHG